jgi:Na+-transporting NADH:ubiquinone oxidoreductase subunit F
MIFLWSILVLVLLIVGLAVLLTVAETVLVNYGICVIDVNAGEKSLEIDGGQSLLSGLIESKIFIPSACGGQGTCGFCKIEVLDGGGPILPTETPYITRIEKRDGVRLACQVKIRQDIKVKIPEDLLNVKLFTSTVKSTTPMTGDIKEIRFSLIEPAEIFSRTGQYVQIQAPSPDGPVFRAYSISSAVYETNEVELVVRLIPGGIGSTYLHNLEVGDTVQFTGPYGDFILDEDPECELICVGGGAGMAPMKNIIYSIYREQPDRTCWLFFGCRAKEDIFYIEMYEELAKQHPNFHVVYGLSEPKDDDDWDGETGFIHLSLDKMIEPGGDKRQAFLCGPPPMIDAVTRVLQAKGLEDNRIFYDEF